MHAFSFFSTKLMDPSIAMTVHLPTSCLPGLFLGWWTKMVALQVLGLARLMVAFEEVLPYHAKLPL